MKKYSSKTSIEINAPVEKVWDALTNPEIVKKYLFGTNLKANWEIGGDITYSGEWEGKAYQDKGKIQDLEVNKKLHTTYWSSMSGTEDKEENYDAVDYDLEENDGKTTLSITQSNDRSQESVDHSMKNWEQVLGEMKKMLESND